MSRWSLLGGVVLSSLLFATLYFARRGGPAPASDGPSSVAAPPAAGAPRAFDVTWVQTVRFTKPEKGDDALETRLAARLDVTDMGAQEGHVLTQGALSGIELSANGMPIAVPATLAPFGEPFTIEAEPNGRVVSVAFDPGVPTTVRGFIKSIISEAQVVTGPGENWSALEEDTTGEYEANYERKPGAPAQVRKVKSRYIRIAGASGLRPASETGDVKVTHASEIELAGDGPVSIETRAHVEMEMDKGMPRASWDTLFTLRRRPDAVAAARVATTPRQKEPMAMASSPVDAVAERRAADEAMAKDVTLEDLTKELGAKQTLRERAEVMERIKAAFRLRPDDTRRAVELVRTVPVEDGKSITAALGGVQSAAALKALADIGASSNTPLDVRTNAITALAIHTTPSPESVRALTQMMADGEPQVSASATLALGGAVRHVRESDPGAYSDAIRTLVNGETSAQSNQQKALYLRALGNAGDPALLPLAEQALEDPDLELRLAAVTSVRFVADARADALLTRALQSDADAAVRALAVDTIEGYRAIAAFLPTFSGVLHNDAVPHVRYLALHALNVVRSLPAAMELIRFSASNDPAEDVRTFAQAVLSQPGATQ